jgi:hypothetical protein
VDRIERRIHIAFDTEDTQSRKRSSPLLISLFGLIFDILNDEPSEQKPDLSTRLLDKTADGAIVPDAIIPPGGKR